MHPVLPEFLYGTTGGTKDSATGFPEDGWIGTGLVDERAATVRHTFSYERRQLIHNLGTPQ